MTGGLQSGMPIGCKSGMTQGSEAVLIGGFQAVLPLGMTPQISCLLADSGGLTPA